MKVTVAVAVYNGSTHIPGCIACLSEQVYRDFEVVFVVDSKTTDNSVELIEEGASSLPSCRVVIQNDSDRLGGARNIGIREASGELIWFLDVDDHPYPDFLSELVRIQGETGADIVFCNHIQLTERAVPPEPSGEYKRVYESSIAHQVLQDVDDRTMEMNVFSRFRSLYYLALYPFTHWIWDRRTGPWGPER